MRDDRKIELETENREARWDERGGKSEKKEFSDIFAK